jgi:beta-glucosidase
MKGDEVAQVYLRNTNNVSKSPIRSLVEFVRVPLEPGESGLIQLWLSPDVFSSIDEEGKKVILPGKYQVDIGGGQPDSGVQTLSATVTLR